MEKTPLAARESDAPRIEDKLDSVDALVAGDFIYSLIAPSAKSGDVESYLDFFGVADSSYCLMAIALRELSPSGRERSYLALRAGLASSFRAIAGPFMHDRVIAYVPIPDALDPADRERLLRARVAAFCDRASALLACRASIGVSAISADFARSSAAYAEALDALARAGDSVAFAFDEPPPADAPYPEKSVTRLVERALAGDLAETRLILSSLTAWIVARYPGDLDALRNELFSILSVVRFRARAACPGFGGFPVWKDTWARMRELDSPEALEAFARSGFEECARAGSPGAKERVSPSVIRACAIINESLAEDLSLEEVARRAGVSPFYFSKIFKEGTGENFIDYLTMARMRRAKALLRETDLSVRAVSVESGYADPNYFSKLFRKVVGLAPTEWRASLVAGACAGEGGRSSAREDLREPVDVLDAVDEDAPHPELER